MQHAYRILDGLAALRRLGERLGENPNVLTLDKGSSKLAQAPIVNSCLVEVERFEGEPPRIAAFDPPLLLSA
jgi:hypothetical protein